VLLRLGNINSGFLHQKAKQLGGAQAQASTSHKAHIDQLTSCDNGVWVGSVHPDRV
jgi:hypothetical protein